MKKISASLCVALIILFVFACTMPSKVEIKGTPSLTFAANMDFGNYFSDMTDNIVNADSETRTLHCTNSSLEYMAFIIYMEIFKKDDYRCEVVEDSFDEHGEGTIIINGSEIPVELIETGANKKFLVLENEEIIAESDEPYTITFNGLEDYLEGFEFTGIQSKVYIYGTELANAVSIDLYRVKPDEPEVLIVEDGDITLKIPSGVEPLEEYAGIGLPPGGANLDISDVFNSGGDLSLKYKIYMPKDSEIDYEWVDDIHTIVAEIVIWLPMTFESIDENANFKFPEFFNGVTDILKTLSDTGSIEDIKIKISIDPLNPFGSGVFVISDEGYGNIINSLDKHNFFINLNEEEIDYINNNPFDPKYFVLFPEKNSLLTIPDGDIMITTVTLDAKLLYNTEF